METVSKWKVKIAVAFAGMLAAVSVAEVKIGENLIYNGRFDGDQVSFPDGWASQPWALPPPKWNQSGGPDGIPSITLDIDPKVETILRQDRGIEQSGLKLSESGRFRVSAKLRLTGFSLGKPGKDLFVLGVTDNRPEHVRGITSPPLDADGRWAEVSAEFDGFPSKTGSYVFYMFAEHFSGTIEIADIKLEAIDETAARGTMPGFATQIATIPRIVPWHPVLGEIPETTREVAFRFLGKLPDGISATDCDMELTVAETDAHETQPLNADGENRFRVPVGCDDGVLKMKVVRRSGAKTLAQRRFRYRIVKVPSKDNLAKHVRLNTVVTEILREKVRGKGELSFGTVRRGWIYVAVKSAADAKATAWLDGRQVIFENSPRHETVREIPAGNHVLKVCGAGDDDEVVVRRIPEIYDYCPADPIVPENGRYIWDFQEKYVLPGITTFNGGNVPEPERDWLIRRGYLWANNMHSFKLKDDDDLLDRLLKHPSMSGSTYDGMSLDEQYWYNFEQNSRLMNSLRRYDLENCPSKAIYTWIVGKPLRFENDVDVMSACVNMSLGRGKIASELYCRTQATQQDAKNFITQYMRDTIKRYAEMNPSIVDSLGVVVGNFNQSPVLSLCIHPEVDYRQYLDMQFNVLANDSAFDGLALVGVWGSYYSDRELQTWCFKLMRHYFIEGRKDMLSDNYGLKYQPGHVANGDFRGTLEPWKVEGDVDVGFFRGLGSKTEGRWMDGDGIGDHYARFRRGDHPNAIRQTLKGLVSGRSYYLQFMTFDSDALEAGKPKVARFGLDAILGDGTTVIGKSSWLHIDRRVKQSGRTTPNLHHIVFKVTRPDVEVTITDAAARSGETLGVNAIGVYPVIDE